MSRHSVNISICQRIGVCATAFLFDHMLAAQPAYGSGFDPMVAQSVVRVDTGNGHGSGFVVGNGFVVTNEHVIRGNANPRIHWEGGAAALPAAVVWSSTDFDLAILRVPNLPLPPLRLSAGSIVSANLVYAVGFPGVMGRIGAENTPTITSGIVGRQFARRLRGGIDMPVLQHSADISPGNSGGPLLDLCNRVVGINTFIGRDALPNGGSVGIAANFAVSVRVLLDPVRQAGASPILDDSTCAPDNSTIEAARQLAEQSERRAVDAQRDAERANRRTGLLLVWMVAILFLAIAALVLAARKPRRYIVNLVQTLSRPLKALGHTSNGPVDSTRPPPRISSVREADYLSNEMNSAQRVTELVLLEINDKTPRKIIIGRDPEIVDKIFDDIYISREHAEVSIRGEDIWVRDLGSRNGTWLDGKRLPPFQMSSVGADSRLVLGRTKIKLVRRSSK